jgi:hypothetical protein
MTKINESEPVVDVTTNVPLYDDGLAPDIVKASPVERPWSLALTAVTVALAAVTVPLAPLEKATLSITQFGLAPVAQSPYKATNRTEMTSPAANVPKLAVVVM